MTKIILKKTLTGKSVLKSSFDGAGRISIDSKELGEAYKNKTKVDVEITVREHEQEN